MTPAHGSCPAPAHGSCQNPGPRKLTARRIVALIVMLAGAVASMWLIDGRVMRTMQRYHQTPHEIQHSNPDPGDSRHQNGRLCENSG